MTTLFSLEKVSLAYDKLEVLKDLEIKIAEGEFVGVLGPNGCGKTTLLNLLAGVLRPTEGQVRLYERDLRDYSRRETARIVSVLPQETFVEFPFSALEVVLMGRAPYLGRFQWESPRDVQIAREAMALTDSLSFADRDIRFLSGGERERVLLARAIAQEPKALLLDEPTTHLDIPHQSEIFHLLKKLHTEKRLTMIVVLHDLNFAAAACSRLLMLSGGFLRADGPAEEVMRAETLNHVFGTELLTGVHPETGRGYFLPKLS